jgi:hypothetical protein
VVFTFLLSASSSLSLRAGTGRWQWDDGQELAKRVVRSSDDPPSRLSV